MIATELEIMIPAPASSVWSLISDPGRMPEWLALCDTVEVLSAGEVGMKLRLEGRTRAGRRSALETQTDVEVTAYAPPRELSWRVVAERLAGKPIKRFARETRFKVSLEPREGDTKVRLRSEMEPRSPVHGIMIRVFGSRAGRRAMARSLQRLKGLATVR